MISFRLFIFIGEKKRLSSLKAFFDFNYMPKILTLTFYIKEARAQVGSFGIFLDLILVVIFYESSSFMAREN